MSLRYCATLNLPVSVWREEGLLVGIKWVNLITEKIVLMEKIGDAIKELKEFREIKNSETLSRKSNLTQGYISKILSNKQKPNLVSLKKIADALEVPMWLILLRSESIEAED